MKILIACEFSGIVRDAFCEAGHDAISCDLLPTKKPGSHYQGDVRDLLTDDYKWDMMIGHPPCTYLSVIGNAWLKKPGRLEKREEAFDFFMKLANANIPKICIENPVGYVNSHWRKPNQIIHPYYFGDARMKRTCLWLKGLPKLKYEPGKYPKPEAVYMLTSEKNSGQRVNWCDSIGKRNGEGWKIRSRTSVAIAEAMATQWG
ncbi:MAG: DNA cytosine methyltransferase [Candidatus Nanoarchaeia archaeon]